MKETAILERIIAEEGSCCWAKPSVCLRCPLGSLVRSDDSSFMSCVEAVGIDGLSEEEANIKYKEAAISKLAELTLSAILEEEN